MRFLIDANMPRSIIALVASLGHEVEFARDVGLAAAPDHEIAARAQATGAALLTRDLDFADVRRYPPSLYPGIIVLRLSDGVIAKDIAPVFARSKASPAMTARTLCPPMQSKKRTPGVGSQRAAGRLGARSA
jgi:predicted nuclease of predicted toxin-antitoxin system